MAFFSGYDSPLADYGWLFPGSPQPQGYSVILNLSSYYDRADIASFLEDQHYDWSRIAAVVIDEPYAHPLINANVSSCSLASQTVYTTVVGAGLAIYTTKENIRRTAEAVHSHLSGTRVWVNFSEPEVRWMMSCDPALNGSYIDVVSLDKYDTPFSGVKPYYDYFEAFPARAEQQLALVPGTFHVTDPRAYRSAQTAADWLQGYFGYANEKNANASGAPLVWAVVGWIYPTVSDPSTGNIECIGFSAVGSEPIVAAWRKERWKNLALDEAASLLLLQ